MWFRKCQCEAGEFTTMLWGLLVSEVSRSVLWDHFVRLRSTSRALPLQCCKTHYSRAKQIRIWMLNIWTFSDHQRKPGLLKIQWKRLMFPGLVVRLCCEEMRRESLCFLLLWEDRRHNPAVDWQWGGEGAGGLFVLMNYLMNQLMNDSMRRWIQMAPPGGKATLH